MERSMMKVLTKAFAALMVTALTLACAGLAGCAQEDPEEAVRASLAAELNQIQNLDADFLEQLNGYASEAGLDALGIQGSEFFKAYFDGFDYSIGDVTVDGDTATAQVTLTAKNMGDIASALTATAEGLAATEDLASLSEEDLNTRLGTLIAESVKGVAPVELEPITLTLEHEDGQWVPTPEALSALQEALFSMSGE